MPVQAAFPALLTAELGNALRRARLRRGLTLRQMELASHGLYKPSSVASYERGERKITVERLCLIAAFLGTDPGRLVTEAHMFASIRAQGDIVIDLRDLTLVLPTLDEAERRVAEELILQVRGNEGDRDAAVLSRERFIQLAGDMGRSPRDLVQMLGAAIRGSSPAEPTET